MGKKILILFMTLCATVVFSQSNLKELIKTDDYHFIHVIMNHPSDSGLESSCSWYKFEYEYLDEQANYERTDEQLKKLKEEHFKRIELSDAILVINKNNYIGDSTKLEIEYAKKLGKEIMYYTDLINEN